MSTANWSDQPDAVCELPVVFRAFLNHRIIEIRADEHLGGHTYVTAGTLFGSQTLRCASLMLAVKTADMIAHVDGGGATKKLRPLPGTLLLDNREEVAS